MKEDTSSTTKSDPIIIEQAGMRLTVAHRQGLGGSDEGLTFDLTTAGSEKEEKRIFVPHASVSLLARECHVQCPNC
jgi:hypothetical protein